jgi:hypothetical protein
MHRPDSPRRSPPDAGWSQTGRRPRRVCPGDQLPGQRTCLAFRDGALTMSNLHATTPIAHFDKHDLLIYFFGPGDLGTAVGHYSGDKHMGSWPKSWPNFPTICWTICCANSRLGPTTCIARILHDAARTLVGHRPGAVPRWVCPGDQLPGRRTCLGVDDAALMFAGKTEKMDIGVADTTA